MATYRIEKSAPTPEKAVLAFKAEHDNVSKRLAAVGGLPFPTLEYVLQVGAKEGRSPVDFSTARENLKSTDAATSYTMVGKYDLPKDALELLNENKRPTSGPAINERTMPYQRF